MPDKTLVLLDKERVRELRTGLRDATVAPTTLESVVTKLVETTEELLGMLADRSG